MHFNTVLTILAAGLVLTIKPSPQPLPQSYIKDLHFYQHPTGTPLTGLARNCQLVSIPGKGPALITQEGYVYPLESYKGLKPDTFYHEVYILNGVPKNPIEK